MMDIAKLFMLFNGGCESRFRGFFFGAKVSQVCSPAVSVYIGLPTFVASVVRHSSHLRRVIRKQATVLHVLISRTPSNIREAIIQSVMVTVITKLSSFQSEKHAVHSLSTITATCVEGFRADIPVSNPVPLHEPFVLRGVNCSDLAFGERYQSDRLIKRLNNRRTVNAIFSAAFGHNLTPNEIAVFDRSVILAGTGRM